jgi:hypothetical protein
VVYPGACSPHLLQHMVRTAGISVWTLLTLKMTASEVCPTNLRGYLTTYVNLCWAAGQFIAAGVLRGCLPIQGSISWKIPFAVQWVSNPNFTLHGKYLFMFCRHGPFH